MASALPAAPAPTANPLAVSPSADAGVKALMVGAAQKYGLPMDFTTSVLKNIGAPVTPKTTAALGAWQKAEGGPSDNPLNTTLGQGSAQGSAIKGYGSTQAGISATTRTLQNGLYAPVLQAFRRNESPGQIRAAIIASPWSGSSHYAGTDYAKGLVSGGGAAPSTSGRAAAPPQSPTSLALNPTQSTPAVGVPTTRDALTSALLNSNGKGLTAAQLLGAITPTTPSTGPSPGISGAPAAQATTSLPSAPVPGKGDPVAGQTPAPPSAFRAMLDEANKISGTHSNYEWGGGHNPQFAPTTGSGHGSGPGVGYDCSGAISAILHAAGKLDQPMVAQQFMSYGLPGPGSKQDLTIYASPTHVFAEINGRYFGTSMANPGGGAGWFTQAAVAGYAVRHVSLQGGPSLHLNPNNGNLIAYRKQGA